MWNCDLSERRRISCFVLIHGQPVEPGTLNDIAVFWTDGEKRRAILADSYGAAHETVERILRKVMGRGAYDNLRAKIGGLAEPGTAIMTASPPHKIGLVRPFLSGHTTDVAAPYLVCRIDGYVLNVPVLCPSLQDARAFARSASLAGNLSRSGWSAFQGERLRSPIERLFVRASSGSVVLRSELEEELNDSLAKARVSQPRPARKRRAA
jgi:hypothetical protein